MIHTSCGQDYYITTIPGIKSHQRARNTSLAWLFSLNKTRVSRVRERQDETCTVFYPTYYFMLRTLPNFTEKKPQVYPCIFYILYFIVVSRPQNWLLICIILKRLFCIIKKMRKMIVLKLARSSVHLTEEFWYDKK